MKTTTAAAYANTDYSSIVTLMFKLMVAFAALQTLALIVFGLTKVGLAIILGIAPIAMITSIVVIGRSWPTIEGGWSWSRFWAGTFGVSRIGYERPGLKALPWIVIIVGSITYGLVLGVFKYELALVSEQTQTVALQLGAIEVASNAIVLPIAFALVYGVGYLFGGPRQRKLQAA